MQLPVYKVLLTSIWGITWGTNSGEIYLSPFWEGVGDTDTFCQSVFSFLLFLLSLFLSHCLSLYLFFSTLSLSWHWHFHLLPWGLEMSLREVLVRLSGSSRALWLWQTSFNWEEARRVWKNWNIHESPFIRHNLNSAWKKPYMYKEKSTSLLLCVLPSYPPGTGRLLRDSIFSFFWKCQSRFVLCGWVNRKGMQMSLTHAHTHREQLVKGSDLGEMLAGCSFT